MDTPLMRMLKYCFNKGRVGLVKLAQLYNLLCHWMRVVRQKLFCKGGSARLLCPMILKPKGIKRLCHRCSHPRLDGDASLFLYFFK